MHQVVWPAREKVNVATPPKGFAPGAEGSDIPDAVQAQDQDVADGEAVEGEAESHERPRPTYFKRSGRSTGSITGRSGVGARTVSKEEQ